MTSLCQAIELVLLFRNSRKDLSSAPRWTRWTSGYPFGAPLECVRSIFLGIWCRTALPGGVNVQSAKVFAKFQCLFNGKRSKVLVPKCDHLSLGYQQSQFIFALVVQLRELDAGDFGANGGCEVVDLASSLQQVVERGIGIFSMLVMLEWFQWSISARRGVSKCDEVSGLLVLVLGQATACGLLSSAVERDLHFSLFIIPHRQIPTTNELTVIYDFLTRHSHSGKDAAANLSVPFNSFSRKNVEVLSSLYCPTGLLGAGPETGAFDDTVAIKILSWCVVRQCYKSGKLDH